MPKIGIHAIENSFTWTGLAAISSPASVPPTTRPSGLAKEMLIPPVLLVVREPPNSVGVKDPDKERISNRPYTTILHKEF